MTKNQKLAVILHTFEHSWPDLAHRIEEVRKEVGNDDLVKAVIVQAVEAMGMRDAGLLPEPDYFDH